MEVLCNGGSLAGVLKIIPINDLASSFLHVGQKV